MFEVDVFVNDDECCRKAEWRKTNDHTLQFVFMLQTCIGSAKSYIFPDVGERRMRLADGRILHEKTK